MFPKLQQRLLRLVAGVGRRAHRRARRLELRGTPAAALQSGHIDSLELLKLARDSGPPVRVVYDLGANVGTWTLLAKAVIPGVVVEAFEPLSAHAQQFLAVTGGVPSVRLHQVALGANAGEARLKVTSYSDAASLLDVAAASKEDFGVIPGPEVGVLLAPLDQWVAAHDLRWPDLIKLDLQGYEIEALKGAKHCLEHARWVLCEMSFREYYHGQPSFAEVVRFLDAAGFDLRAFPSTGHGLVWQQTDALFEARPKRRAAD